HQEADGQLQAVVARLQEEHPETNRVMGAGFMPFRDFLTRDVRTPLRVLLGAVVLLLLLACANVANLLLVRTGARSRELALRRALGAGRGRVARQVFTESALLALAGSAGGLVLGWGGVRAITAMTRLGIAGATNIALDGRVLTFVLAVAGLSTVLFGSAPAFRSSRGDVGRNLGDGGRTHSGGRGSRRAARILVGIEITLAVVLVVGAGLMVRSFLGLRSVHPGFQVDDVLAVELVLPVARYEERDQVVAFWDRLGEALSGRPEIMDVGTVEQLPLTGTNWTSQVQAEGWEPDRVGFEIVHRRADSGYFRALDIPLIRGRLFESADRADAPPVVVINEAFAREHFPAEDPIGQRIAFTRNATPESTWYEIVGVVGDQRQVSPRDDARPEVFENPSQDWSRSAWVVVETSSPPLDVLSTVQAVIAELDPELPLAEARTLRDVWSASLESEEFVLTLLGVFGAVALLLATVGIYGVTAQAARQRTREIGVRMAMGARAEDVIGLMLREGVVVLALGVGVGLGLALVTTRALSSLVYGIEPTDPATLVAVTLLLGCVALVACWIPARRAAAADPMETLRAE
ncbi:MAG: ADOP family duplicated permease, partial [Longimicrobiales bacterium]|nr:ADOP family duplicated permease [Longimicrobiales bacterium]